MRNTLKQYVQTAKTFVGYAMEDKEITNAVKVSAATAALLTGAEFTRRMYRDHGLKAMFSFKAGAQSVRDNKALYAGYTLAVLVYHAARINGEYQTGQRMIRKIQSVELDLYENSLQEVNEFLSTLTPVDEEFSAAYELCECDHCEDEGALTRFYEEDLDEEFPTQTPDMSEMYDACVLSDFSAALKKELSVAEGIFPLKGYLWDLEGTIKSGNLAMVQDMLMEMITSGDHEVREAAMRINGASRTRSVGEVISDYTARLQDAEDSLTRFYAEYEPCKCDHCEGNLYTNDAGEKHYAECFCGHCEDEIARHEAAYKRFHEAL